MSAKNSVNKVNAQSWEFEHVIWQIVAHPSGKIVFIEERDQANKQVQFHALDLESGNWLWRGLTFEESWWISLTASREHMLYLTVYTNPQNPDNKSLLAFDYLKKEVGWFKNNFSFLGMDDACLAGWDTRQLKKIHIDARDGRVVSPPVAFATITNNALVTPHHYPEGTPDFETVRAFLYEKFAVTASKMIEYLEYEQYAIISYYMDSDTLANYLLVVDTKGDALVEEKLGEQLQGIAVDSFFILLGSLIFVRNKNVLVSYKLI